jgi:hypothetical protein
VFEAHPVTGLLEEFSAYLNIQTGDLRASTRTFFHLIGFAGIPAALEFADSGVGIDLGGRGTIENDEACRNEDMVKGTNSHWQSIEFEAVFWGCWYNEGDVQGEIRIGTCKEHLCNLILLKWNRNIFQKVRISNEYR